LRDSLIARNRPPFAPCPHCGPCPLPGGKVHGGGKGRWCHFAFETEDAPKELHKLSAAAGIPKERAVLSFLFAANPAQARPAAEAKQTAAPGLLNKFAVRIISDAFPLPQGRMGRYSCSEQGLVLAAGERAHIESMASGALLACQKPGSDSSRDPKSGALVVDLTR
jgi:hypothetical protein